jgi:adenylosuccinate synthase
LRRAIITSSITGLCVTKLDVLDGLERIKICIGYRLDGAVLDAPPYLVGRYEDCEPVYEELPGWKTSTVGINELKQLPEAARVYLRRLEQILKVPVDMISTGPDRDENIIIRHPFD